MEKESLALNRKEEARQLFHAAMLSVDVRAAVKRSFRVQGSRLLAADQVFLREEIEEILLIAIGKAATPMYEATIDVLEAADWPSARVASIVVSPQLPRNQLGRLTYFQGSHPTPDETSRQAASGILSALHRADARTLVLFLMSGGSSAMVELPLDPAITQEEIALFYRMLVGSGLSITEINTLRKQLSATKGGRLAQAAAPAMQCTLIVSDVPANQLDVVGSGPSLPDLSSRQDGDAFYTRLRAIRRVPAHIERFFESDRQSETPKPWNAAFQRAGWACILSADDLSAGAASEAKAAGMHVEIDNTCDEWASEDAAAYLLDRSEHMAVHHGRCCLISVGEVSVRLPEASGRGGRNQHFALQCALRLHAKRSSTVVLSAGSDGIDGNSPAAGALADHDTCERAFQLGMDPSRILLEFDSFNLFDRLGDVVMTGPTGNNVRDLRLLLT